MENNVMSPEERHYEMDDLMCRVLESLGYSEGIDIFTNSMRWYA